MAILLISVIELQTAIHDIQFNPVTVSLIIFSFVFIERKKPFLAALFIVTGFLVKLYGIVGICFICFSTDRLKLIYYIFFWLVVLFCLPMVISSPSFIVKSYQDWYQCLIQKNAANIDISGNEFWQDISVMGMIRRIGKLPNMPNIFVLIPASIFYLAAFFRKSQHKYYTFRLAYLAFVLIGVVIFSTSAESPTYIIASIGVGIWFIIQPDKKSAITISLLVLTFLVSNFFANYIFPEVWLKHYFYNYSIKAMPYFLIWLLIGSQIVRRDYKASDNSLLPS